MNERSDELILFMHIPKTAGTTLRAIVERQYQPDQIAYIYHDPYRGANYKDRQSVISKISYSHLKCIYGHFGFGIWLQHLGKPILSHYHIPRPITYITMLRDPIEFVISLYFFMQYLYSNIDPNNVLLKKDLSKRLPQKSFEEFIKTGPTNVQTVWVTGGIEDLQTAKENLQKYFKLVGITEMFNESVFMMKKELGWKDIHYKKQNVLKNRPSQDELPKDLVELIKKKNALDIELYYFAKRLLENRIQYLDPKSKDELNRFISTQHEK